MGEIILPKHNTQQSLKMPRVLPQCDIYCSEFLKVKSGRERGRDNVEERDVCVCVCVCVKMEKIEQERMVKLPKKDGNWGQFFYFLSITLKITADGDCSHEIKRHLLFGRKAMTNLDSI